MPTTQEVYTISYPRPKNEQTTTTALETEYKVVAPASGTNNVKIEQWMTLDPDNESFVGTVTLTAGTAGDEYVISVDDGTDDLIYRHNQTATDTATTMATFLAAIIDTHPGVRATSAAGVITVTGAIPGVAITVDTSSSTTPANVVAATSTPASGTALHRKISDITIGWTVDTSGFPTITVDEAIFYSGAASPTSVSTRTNIAVGKGSKTLDTIQTENGVARPA